MTDTKTTSSKKDRDELAKELARRKAEPVVVTKPVKTSVHKGRNVRVTVDGIEIPTVGGVLLVTK